MLSHNNWRARIEKYEPKKQRFTLKKLTIGVASVLLGFAFAGTSTASADDGNQQGVKPEEGTASQNNSATVATASQATLTTKAATAVSAAPASANPAGDIKQDQANSYEQNVAAALNQSLVQADSTAASTPAPTSAPASSSAATDQEATQIVRYVNNANTSEVIGTQPFTGKVGTSVDIYNHLQAPANWQLVAGQQVQTTAVLQPNANPIDVLIEHQKEIEYGYQHKEDNNFYRTVTRTIMYNFPGEAPQKMTQPVTYSRNKITDKVTGMVTYDNWEPTTVDQNHNKVTTFPQIAVPEVPGYTAIVSGAQLVTENGKQYLSAVNVTPDNPPALAVVNYTPQKHQLVINYVDSSNHSNIVGTQTVPGYTGQHVDVILHAPANWKLASGQQVLKGMTFGSSDPATQTVFVEHDSTAITNAPDLNKTISYTVKGVMGGQKYTMAESHWTFFRTATKDSVTGAITYGKWSNNGQTQAVRVAQDGYTAKAYDQNGQEVAIVNGQLPAMTITPDMANTTITVIYNKNNDQQPSQGGQDQQGDRVVRFNVFENVNGHLLSTTTVTGKVGETVPVHINIPDGWTVVPGTTLPTSYTFPATATVDQQIYVTRDTNNNDLNRTVTRQILADVQGSGEQPSQIGLQRADFMRSGVKDSVTGQMTYGDWKQEGSIDAFQIPQRAGYTTQVDGKNTTELPAENVNADSKSSIVTVVYVPTKGNQPNPDQEQTIHVNFVEQATGSLIAATPVTGKAGQKVDLTGVIEQNLPTNWQKARVGAPVPNSITFGSTVTPDVTVYIEHGREAQPDKTVYVGNEILAHFDDGRTYQIGGVTTNAPVRVYKDLITGQIVEEDFAGTVNIPSFQIPDKPGYTFERVEGPDITNNQTRTIPGMTATRATDGVRTYTVYYVSNKQTAKINYVDSTDHKTVISTQTVSGKTNQTVNVELNVPAGWEVTSGQNVPSSITFGTTGKIPDSTVYIQHKVEAQAPEVKEVKQTINSIDPVTGTAQPLREMSVKFSRSVSKDMVTNATIKGNWNHDEYTFEGYNVQQIPGYTAQLNGQNVVLIPAETVTPNSQDTVYNVTYVANAQQVHINYVDAANHSNVVYTQTVAGKTNETVHVTLQVPTGWQLVGGQNVPASFTFGSTPMQDATVYIEHKTTPVNPTDKGSLSKTVTRTVHTKYPDGQDKVTNRSTVTFTRNGSTDLVTGQTTYGKWNEESHHFADISVQQIPGYTSYVDGTKATTIPGETVTPTSESKTYEVTYTANEQTAKINYVDAANHSNVIYTQTVTGKTGETVNVNLQVPANWQVVSGQNVPSSFTFGSQSFGDTTVYVEHKTTNTTDTSEYANTHRTVTRVVKSNINGMSSILSSVNAEFSRTATKDLVTGETNYGPWTKNVDAPAVKVALDGYAATAVDQNGHQVAIVNGQIPATTITPDTADEVITVNYTANDQTTHIKYVNQENHQLVGTQTISGKTGESVGVKLDVPENYQIVSGQQLPASITFGSKPVADTTIYVEPAKTPVNPGQPGDPNHADTNRTVTRTIYATGAGYSHGLLQQDMANFTRSGMYNPVTHEITYNPWNMDSETFKAFPIPVREGYQAKVNGEVVTSIPALTVTPDSKSTTVEVTYEPVEQSMKINFVNSADHSQIVKSQTVTGKTGETVSVTLDVPAGWRLVGGQTVPTGIGFGAKGHGDVTVYIEHDSEDLTNDPSQISQTHRVVNHVINEVFNGQTTTVASVNAEFNRTATKDLATGKVVYGDWTKNVDFPAVTVTRTGYTARAINQAGQTVELVNGQVPATTITPDSHNETITVTYTANEQSTKINYVNTANNQNVGSQVVAGKTGETVTINLEVPDGYELVSGQQVPASITFGSTPLPDSTVYVQTKKTPVNPDQPGDHGDHGNQPGKPTNPSKIDNQRIVKRTINATDPTGKHILLNEDQANFTRPAQIDSVTGEVTYGAWNETSHQFPEYKIAQLYGYETKVDGKTVTTIPAETVGLDSKDQTIEVVYVPVEQTAKINYVNKDNQVINTQTITGKTGETVNVTLNVPAGWQVAGGQSYPTAITFGGQAQHDWNILVEPKTNPTSENTENRTVSRVVNAVVNGQTSQLSSAVAQFSRTVTKDLVTGKTTYGDWSKGTDFPAVNVERAGYTATVTDQNGQAVKVVNGQIPAETVNADTPSQTITVNYVANNQVTHIKYVDNSDRKTVISTQTITGKTGETVKVTLNVPANYQVANGQSVPASFTFGSTPIADTTVYVEHADKPVNPGQPADPNHADTNRTVTRTIYATGAGYDGGILHQDMANFTRSGMYDPVTQQITYNPWDKLSVTFETFEIPAREGYQATIDGKKATSIPAETVNPDSKNTTFKVVYEPLDQSMKINFVNSADHSQIVKSQKVTGKTGETVPVTLDVPAGWRLVGGQTVPTGIGFGATGHGDVTVYIEHDGQDLTNDPSQASQTHRVVNHVINEVIDGQTTTIASVNAEFNRTATKDLATGKIIYGDWTKNVDFPAVSVARAGYTAIAKTQDGQNVELVNGQVPATTITPDSHDETITVTYTANSQSTTITYIDAKTNQQVGTQTITGKTGETVNINLDVPEGYEAVGGQQVPTSITFGSNPVAGSRIYVQPTTTTPTNPDQPGDHGDHGSQPADPNADIVHLVTRVVYTIDGAGNRNEFKYNMASFTREKIYHSDTDTVTYGPWNKESETFPEIQIPQQAGYQATIDGQNATTIPAVTVNPDSQNSTITIKYVPVEQSMKVNYIDKNDESHVISSQTITGKTGQEVPIDYQVPANWWLVGGKDGQQLYKSVIFGTTPQKDVNVVIAHMTKNVTDEPSQLSKTHRHVDYVVKDIFRGKTYVVSDLHFDFARPATKDLVTGEITYGDWWQPAQEIHYMDFDRPGYTAHAVNADGSVYQLAPGAKIPAATFGPDSKSVYITVTHTPNDQSMKINYVNVANDQVVASQTVNGKTDETVPVTLQVPANWQLVAGEKVPTSITFGENGTPDVKVYIEHKTTPVKPGQPGNPNHADTNRTVTRTIYATGAGYNHGRLHQDMANFTRGGTYDQVNNVITYDPWDKDSQTFAAYQIPQYYGYQALVDGQATTSIPALTVTPDSKNTEVEVTYEPVEQSMKINFVNKDDHSQIVASQKVTGKTDETVPVTLQVPAGWRLVGGQNVPTGIGFGSTPHDNVTVYIEHDSQDLTNDPSQAGQTHRVVNRAINEVFNGQTTTVASVKAEFNRTATKDLATGKVTYGNWTKNVDFPAVNVAHAGYTASAKNQAGQVVELVNGQVPATTLTPDSHDETITVTYTANDQSTTITYVNTKTNQQVGTQTVTGKTGETVNINLQVPAGYEIVGGQQVPSTITFGSTPVHGSTVYVQPTTTNPDQPGDHGDHGNQPGKPTNPSKIDNQRIVKRTINATDPTGKHILLNEDQANFTRPARIDSVTGEVTYGAWNETSHQFPEYKIAQLYGYETKVDGKTVTTIPAETVGLDSKDQTIEVVYAPVEQTAKINYINKDNQVVGTQTITGKTGEQVPVKLDVPAGWQIANGQTYPTVIGFGGQPQTDWNILVEPKSNPSDDHGNGGQTDQTQSTKINFVNKATGKTVGTQTVTGKVGETVNVTLNVPAGYEVIGGQQVPSSYTFGTKPIADTTVYVQAKTTPANPGQPGDPNHPDTNRTVTRTIYATGAGYNHGILHQDKANFMRGGTYDPSTGLITYKPWNKESEDFAAFTIPVRDGYQALVDGKVATVIPAVTVNPDSKNTEVEVTYEPVEQSMKINFVNKDNHSQVIGSQTITGKTGETVPVKLAVPEGWRMVGGQSVPTGIGFGSKPHGDVTIYVEHATQDLTNDPSQADQTHRVISHVVNEVINGTTTTVASVKAEFNRTATKDLATGKVIYGNWTKNVDFPAVNVTRGGYTAVATDQDGQTVALVNGQVPATTITPDSKNVTITVTYAANEQSTKINFVNKDNNQVIGSQTVTGKTGETVNITLNVPEGWQAVGGQQVPSTITFGSTPIADSTVYVEPKPATPGSSDATKPGSSATSGNSSAAEPGSSATSGNSSAAEPGSSATSGNSSAAEPGSSATSGNSSAAEPGSSATSGNSSAAQPGSSATSGNSSAAQPGSSATSGNSSAAQPGSSATSGSDSSAQPGTKQPVTPHGNDTNAEPGNSNGNHSNSSATSNDNGTNENGNGSSAQPGNTGNNSSTPSDNPAQPGNAKPTNNGGNTSNETTNPVAPNEGGNTAQQPGNGTADNNGNATNGNSGAETTTSGANGTSSTSENSMQPAKKVEPVTPHAVGGETPSHTNSANGETVHSTNAGEKLTNGDHSQSSAEKASNNQQLPQTGNEKAEGLTAAGLGLAGLAGMLGATRLKKRQ